MIPQNVQMFAARVRSAAPPALPRPVIELAIDNFVKLGRAEQQYVADCIHLAGQIVEVAKAEAPPAQSVGIFDLAREPDSVVLEEALFEHLETDVIEVRREMFGGPETPFSDYALAVEWIERESAADRKRVPLSNSGEFPKTINRLRKLLDKMSDAIGRPVSASIETPVLRYVKPGSGILGIKVKLGSKLLLLLAFAQSGESRYGFTEYALIAYALAGIRPQLARITVATEISSSLKLPKTTITILARRPSWNDLRRAYRLIREESKRKRARRFDEEDEALFSAIRKHGGVPWRKGAQGFWQRVGAELRMSAGAVRMRFQRLPQEIKAKLRFGKKDKEAA
jgi:hypothetical protein